MINFYNEKFNIKTQDTTGNNNAQYLKPLDLKQRVSIYLKGDIDEEGYLYLNNETEATISNISISVKALSFSGEQLRKLTVDSIAPYTKKTFKEFGIFPIIGHNSNKSVGNFNFAPRGLVIIEDGYMIK